MVEELGQWVIGLYHSDSLIGWIALIYIILVVIKVAVWWLKL